MLLVRWSASIHTRRYVVVICSSGKLGREKAPSMGAGESTLPYHLLPSSRVDASAAANKLSCRMRTTSNCG